MRRLAALCLLLILWGNAWGKVDSIGFSMPSEFPQRIDRHTSTKAYRMTFVAVPLIAGGVVMQSYDRNFQSLRNGYASSFAHSYDDYLQYAPAALMVGLKAFGVQGRSSWGRMLVSDAFSAGIMAIAVNSLKHTMRVMRPDGSSRNSFPSGHTATAFMTATMLHKEYGQRSPWYSIGGYAAAMATGITRQLNNRHWMSDVMVGAGIGILTTELGYFLADLIFKKWGLYACDDLMTYDRYRKPSFFSLNVGFSVVPGHYNPYPGTRVSFASGGPSVGVQGAWFATPYVGVGGRLAVSSLHVTVNGVGLNGDLQGSSAFAGLYLSYPISARWLLGSKVLGGYEHYRHLKIASGVLGDRGGISFGTGITMTYVANHNFGIRFTTDYDMAPPLVPGSRQRLHKLTLGLAVSALL